MLNRKHSKQRKLSLRLRTMATLLALLMLPFSLLACKKDPTPELPDYSGETVFKVTEGDTSLVRVVYPAGVDGTQYRSFANEIARRLKNWTGVEPEVITDDEPETGREILIGNTNREFSDTAYLPIAKEQLAFLFASNGGKLAILSSAPQAMTYAFAYLDLQYNKALGFQKTDEGASFPVNLNVRHSVKLPAAAEPSQELSSVSTAYLWKGSEEVSLSVDTVFHKPIAVSAGTAELFVAWGDDDNRVRISKYKTNGTLIKNSTALSVKGATAICYDATVNTLAVAHGNDKKDVTLLDANTLTPLASYTAAIDIEALTYDFLGMRYFAKVKGEATYNYLNESFALDTKIPVTATMDLDSIAAGTVSQRGMGQDQKFLYQLCVAEGKKTQVFMAVQEFNGKRHLVNQVDLGGKIPVSTAKFPSEFLVLATNAAKSAVSIYHLATTTVNVSEPFSVYDSSSNIDKVDSSGVSLTKVFDLYDFLNDGKHTALQGACTDGKYGYFMMEYQGGSGNYNNSWTHTTVIVKIDMATKKMVKKSGELKLGHSNGACYNPLTNQILVAYCGAGSATESWSNVICVVDADTLKLVEYRTLVESVSSITYNPYTGHYLCGSGKGMVTLDSNFNRISYITTIGTAPFIAENNYQFGNDEGETTMVTQSEDSDSKYMYWILTATTPQKWTNYIVAYDHAGNYAFTKVIPNLTYEGEHLFHIGNTIYASFYNKNETICYKVNIK